MSIFNKLLILICIISLPGFVALGQKSNKITDSNLVAEVIKKKKQNPKITDQALADYANELLASKGFNYHLEMSELFFQKTSRQESLETRKEQYIKFPFEFSLVNNGKKSFEITAKHNLQNECYDESTPAFPVTQITENRATVMIGTNPSTILIPKEFNGTTVYLMDSKTRKKVMQKWVSPYLEGVSEESFVGFSADGKKLYITVQDAYIFDYDVRQKVKELALEISAEGKLRFVPKSSVKKNFKVKYEPITVTNLKADLLLKITIGNKLYYLAVPDTSC